MKLSISLSEPAGVRLGSVVKAHDANPSVVLEAALLHFADLSSDEQEREVRHLQQARRANSRDGWMRVFWEALAEEFGTRDFDWTGQGNPLTPRQHHGFSIVYLFDERSPTSGPIYVHAFQSPAIDSRALIQNWTYTKDDPVFSAARSVANWIRENEQHTTSASV
jgi:hypothetical protein